MMEVRYHMLRPEQIVTRREECPVVYIPIGTLEWHGVHNAVGADALQAEGIAIRCAEKGGGLVFPPLYYGENRLESLMEATEADRYLIAEKMELDPGNFTAARSPFSATEQTLNYNKLLLHILSEADNLGFKIGIFVAGHYPLIDHAKAAVLQYSQMTLNRKGSLIPWAFADYQLVQEFFENAGDHAAVWETSHMLALYPETVDLKLLPPKGEKLVGVMGNTYPQDATREYGREIIERAADIAVKEVLHRLNNPQLYTGHGMALKEGLWKGDKQ
jgi:creatinine amidohydrolase